MEISKLWPLLLKFLDSVKRVLPSKLNKSKLSSPVEAPKTLPQINPKWSQDDIDQHIEGTPFTWRDALTQGQSGVIAVPNPTQLTNIARQANALSEIYYRLGGFTVTSWLRTEEHNKAVGGSPLSMHLTGLATDIVHSTIGPSRLREIVKLNHLYPGRTELDAATWCHFDLKNNVDFYGAKK